MKKKLCIIGNSVTLRVRPRVQNEAEKVYSALLQSGLSAKWEVIKHGKSRYLTSELANEIDDFLKYNADIYVLNVGCVDAPPREIPKWYSGIIFKRKYAKLYPIFNSLYKVITTLRMRKYLALLRGRKPWVAINDFYDNIALTIQKIRENTDSKIILVGINSGSSRLEEHLPGILENYDKYNEVLKEFCETKNINFVDVQDLNSEGHFPDGVHYNELGHKIITKRIMEVVNE